jgi:hypothetical protein
MVVFGMALLLSAVAYGFAASNTVHISNAGDGSATISGYSIDNIQYTLNGTTPTTIDSVSFDVTPAASGADPRTVKAKLVSSGGTWFDCTAGTSPNWSCTVTGVTTTQANSLSVVAAD